MLIIFSCTCWLLSSLEKYLFRSFVYFLIGLYGPFCFWVSKFFMFWILTLYQINSLHFFSHFIGCLFILLIFLLCRSFFIYSLLILLAVLKVCHIQEGPCVTKDHVKGLSSFFSRYFMLSHLMLNLLTVKFIFLWVA